MRKQSAIVKSHIVRAVCPRCGSFTSKVTTDYGHEQDRQCVSCGRRWVYREGRTGPVPVWVDATRYMCGGDHGLKIPTNWELKLPTLTITIARHPHHPPDVWVLFCRDVRIEGCALRARELELAKIEALNLVRRRLNAMTADLDAV